MPCTPATNILQDFKSSSVVFTKIFDFNKDLVVTVDYKAYPISGNAITGGILIGILPFFRVAPDGTSAGPGNGYSNVSGLSACVGGNLSALSADGILDAEIGVCLSFDGRFATSATGVDGLSSAPNNSIAVRGLAADSYPLLTVTENLSTASAFDTPFTLFSTSSSTTKRARVRFTDFGRQVVVDCKNTTDLVFDRYLNLETDLSIYQYCRVYVAFAASNSGTHISIPNININGYDETLTYVYSGTDYLGLTPNPAYLSEGDTLSARNHFNTAWSLYSTYSALGTLVLVSGSGAPYVGDDDYVIVEYP